MKPGADVTPDKLKKIPKRKGSSMIRLKNKIKRILNLIFNKIAFNVDWML